MTTDEKNQPRYPKNKGIAPTLLKPVEVADILGVTPSTLAVWRCTKRYKLPFVKAGRLVRYREEDVQAFIGSRLHQMGAENHEGL